MKEKKHTPKATQTSVKHRPESDRELVVSPGIVTGLHEIAEAIRGLHFELPSQQPPVIDLTPLTDLVEAIRKQTLAMVQQTEAIGTNSAAIDGHATGLEDHRAAIADSTAAIVALTEKLTATISGKATRITLTAEPEPEGS